MEQEIIPIETVMVSKRPLAIICRVVFCTLMAVLAGCKTVPSVDVVLQTYPSNEKINLPVALVLNQELCNAVFKWSVPDPPFEEKYRIEMGTFLAENAEGLARAVFREVVIVRPNSERVLPQRVASLTPMLTRTNRPPANSWPWNTVTSTVSIEWKLAAENGEIIWVQEINGLGEHLQGNAFTRVKTTREGLQAALADLFGKSYTAMSSAHEIKNFAATQGVILSK